ncbi:hypothetical protein F5884DRAFT_902112 [Xylogone sp. PMI_703]|nr:hypothetical protein F5884DRAFT_902112 [Xylogone sp. PMI_703]
MYFLLVAFLIFRSTVAQRPSNTSICDYYAERIYGINNALTQQHLVQAITCLAFAGGEGLEGAENATGILNQGSFNGTAVNLIDFFNGVYAISNVNNQPASVNWLDGGGIDPLKAYLNGSAAELVLSNSTKQYHFFNHMVSSVGTLYNCTLLNSTTNRASSPAYVHKFMNLNPTAVGYFIEQLTLASVYCGVSGHDAKMIKAQMNNMYNFRCAPAIDGQLNSICQASTCPLAEPQADCEAYVNITENTPSSSSTQTSLPKPSNASSNSSSSAPSSSKPSPGSIAGISIAAATIFLTFITILFLVHRRKTMKADNAATDGTSLASLNLPARPVRGPTTPPPPQITRTSPTPSVQTMIVHPEAQSPRTDPRHVSAGSCYFPPGTRYSENPSGVPPTFIDASHVLRDIDEIGRQPRVPLAELEAGAPVLTMDAWRKGRRRGESRLE